MGLINFNGRILNINGNRISGGLAPHFLVERHRSDRYNIFMGENWDANTGAWPDPGAKAHTASALPLGTSGSSSGSLLLGTMTLAAATAMAGIGSTGTITGSMSITGTLTGNGALSGTLSLGTCAFATAQIASLANITGTLTGSMTLNAATLGADAGISGVLFCSITMLGTMGGTGNLAGVISPEQILELGPSPWDTVLTGYPDGTAGADLIKASKALQLGQFLALK